MRRLRVLALVVAVAFVAAACSGSDDEGSPGEGNSSDLDFENITVAYVVIESDGGSFTLDNLSGTIGYTPPSGLDLADGVDDALIDSGERAIVAYDEKTKTILEIVAVPPRALNFDTLREPGVENIHGELLEFDGDSLTIQGSVREREFSTEGSEVFASDVLAAYLRWAQENGEEITITYDTEDDTLLAFIS